MLSTMAKRCYPLTKPLVVNPNPIWHKQFKRNCLSSSKNKPQDVRIWMSPWAKAHLRKNGKSFEQIFVTNKSAYISLGK